MSEPRGGVDAKAEDRERQNQANTSHLAGESQSFTNPKNFVAAKKQFIPIRRGSIKKRAFSDIVKWIAGTSSSFSVASGFRDPPLGPEPDRWARSRPLPPSEDESLNEPGKSTRPTPVGAARPREEIMAERGLDSDIDVADSDSMEGSDMPVQVTEKHNLTHRLKPLLRLNYMFQPHYEFYKDDLPRLWSFFGGSQWVTLDSQFFLLSRLDHSTGLSMYKLNQTTIAYLYHDADGGADDDVEYLMIHDVGSHIPSTTRHVSLGGSNIDSSFLDNLYQPIALQTLLIPRGAGSRITCLPHDFFEQLHSLQTLDLSHTNITELPSSIGYSQHLRYLNLSYTSIVELPNTLCEILTLKTLKLIGCSKLKCLPKAIRQLTSLVNLDVDISCLLVSMPPGLGDLKNLRTLPAFVVGKRQGWRITELRRLYIRQSLRILRLENVSSAEEAKEATMHYQHLLHKVEFHWSQLQDGFEVLENLCPRFSIKELRIVGYGGVKFPTWVGDRSFSFIKAITIHNCSKCDALPTLGRLRSLKFLRISDMKEVKVINQQFFGISLHTGDKAFPSLEHFTCSAMPELNDWIGVQKGDFPLLRKLNISDCSKLKALPELSLLQTLQELEISLSPSLESFPDVLPKSLQSIVIIGCPLLKERCKKDVGEDWLKLAHIPNIWIDYQRITLEEEIPEVADDINEDDDNRTQD